MYNVPRMDVLDRILNLSEDAFGFLFGQDFLLREVIDEFAALRIVHDCVEVVFVDVGVDVLDDVAVSEGLEVEGLAGNGVNLISGQVGDVDFLHCGVVVFSDDVLAEEDFAVTSGLDPLDDFELVDVVDDVEVGTID